jgi:hypothetical protein
MTRRVMRSRDPPAVVYACHCTESQKPTGSAFPDGAAFPNRNINPGTLDDPSWLTQTTHFWTRRAQKWVVIPEDAVRCETQPATLSWVSHGGLRVSR